MSVNLSSRQILHSDVLCGRKSAADGKRYHIRFLGAEDLTALEAFRSMIFAALPDIDIYFPETPEFSGLHLGERGVTFGVENDDGQLIACAVLGLPRAGMPAFVDDLPGQRPALETTAHMASCMVDPAHRGNGLQGLLLGMRTLYALGAGRTQLLARVALSNPISLSNLIAGGYMVRRVLVMHSGRLRYLVHRDYSRAPAAWDQGQARVVAVSDVEGQRALLDDGWVGVAVETSGGAARVTYARLHD